MVFRVFRFRFLCKKMYLLSRTTEIFLGPTGETLSIADRWRHLLMAARTTGRFYRFLFFSTNPSVSVPKINHQILEILRPEPPTPVLTCQRQGTERKCPFFLLFFLFLLPSCFLRCGGRSTRWNGVRIEFLFLIFFL